MATPGSQRFSWRCLDGLIVERLPDLEGVAAAEGDARATVPSTAADISSADNLLKVVGIEHGGQVSVEQQRAQTVTEHLVVYTGAHPAHALLQALGRINYLCEWHTTGPGKGDVFYNQYSPEMSVAPPSVYPELKALNEEVRRLAASAPPCVQQHVVAHIVQLAKIAKHYDSNDKFAASQIIKVGDREFESVFSFCGKFQNASTQLYYTHGPGALLGDPQPDGGPKIAAMCECERLGEHMLRAWLAFPAASRAKLVAVPSLNDTEPTVVGTWSEGKPHQNGEPILRPAIRQTIPQGYHPNDWLEVLMGTEDADGDKYVETHLIPAAQRVMPALEALAKDMVASTGSQHVPYAPPLKRAERIKEKSGMQAPFTGDHLLHEYPQQVRVCSQGVHRRIVHEYPQQVRVCSQGVHSSNVQKMNPPCRVGDVQYLRCAATCPQHPVDTSNSPYTIYFFRIARGYAPQEDFICHHPRILLTILPPRHDSVGSVRIVAKSRQCPCCCQEASC